MGFVSMTRELQLRKCLEWWIKGRKMRNSNKKINSIIVLPIPVTKCLLLNSMLLEIHPSSCLLTDKKHHSRIFFPDRSQLNGSSMPRNNCFYSCFACNEPTHNFNVFMSESNFVYPHIRLQSCRNSNQSQ